MEQGRQFQTPHDHPWQRIQIKRNAVRRDSGTDSGYAYKSRSTLVKHLQDYIATTGADKTDKPKDEHRGLNLRIVQGDDGWSVEGQQKYCSKCAPVKNVQYVGNGSFTSEPNNPTETPPPAVWNVT